MASLVQMQQCVFAESYWLFEINLIKCGRHDDMFTGIGIDLSEV